MILRALFVVAPDFGDGVGFADLVYLHNPFDLCQLVADDKDRDQPAVPV